MTYYTVWYWQDNQKIIWATGLTKEEAEAALKVIVEEFNLIAGVDEE